MTTTTAASVSLNVKAEAARLRATGMSYYAISRQLGVGSGQVMYWLDSGYRRRQLDYKRAKWLEGAEAREAKKAASKPADVIPLPQAKPEPTRPPTPQDITRGYREQLDAGFDPLEAMDAIAECSRCGRLTAPISPAYGEPCDCPRVVRAEREAA